MRRTVVGVTLMGGSLLGTLLLSAGVPSLSGAQMRIPEQFTNLQVLPKDISRDDLTGIMRNLTTSLGMRCDACHVSTDGNLEFAADDKDMKKTAREMFRMVADINTRLTGMGRTLDARARVRCVTCHHGLAKPRTLNAELLSTYDARGIDSTKAQLRALRTRWYGRSAYDFSDQSLLMIADELAAGGAPARADAIALLQTQLEFTPQSGATYAGIARLHVAAGDTAQGIAALTKAAEVDPENRQVQQMLNQLRGRRPPS
ncbi:MAG: c-type cytochrome [Gemmatimonadota bacterium]